MLRVLNIRNFAIIEQVELNVADGFSVVTGETGAGKSILVDALTLLLGARAESAAVRSGQAQADLSALFELSPESPASAWLQANAMAEPDQSLLIRRTVQAAGGSRAWINGHPATASQIKDLGGLIVEIHGQHAHQRLSVPEHQRALLDAQCPRAMVNTLVSAHKDWHQATLALEQFEADLGDPAQLELLEFQVTELETLALREGEYQALEAEQEKRQRHGEIRQALMLARQWLSESDEGNAHTLLQQSLSALAPFQTLDERIGNAVSLLQETVINVSEAAGDLDQIDDEADDDPQTLHTINQRIDTTLALARKHRVKPEELPALLTTLSERLTNLQNQGEQREKLNQAVTAALAKWRERAQDVSDERSKVAKSLSAEVTTSLNDLGMNHAALVIEVTPKTDARPSPHGFDQVQILFTANPGQPPQALSKVASGGELSRIALALMLAVGQKDACMTRIFDEVDAGIGGETAHRVGDFLSQLAHHHGELGQALCVTHLPQVASRADHHFFVQKEQGKQTSIEITHLDQEARVRELARMLGNANSQTSLAHAKELIDAHKVN